MLKQMCDQYPLPLFSLAFQPRLSRSWQIILFIQPWPTSTVFALLAEFKRASAAFLARTRQTAIPSGAEAPSSHKTLPKKIHVDDVIFNRIAGIETAASSNKGSLCIRLEQASASAD